MAYKTRAVVPLEDRLFAKVDASGPCWLWTGARNIGGYGVVSKGRRLGAGIVHRLVWEMFVGPIPDGVDMDHMCRVRHCCNPDHLEPVTRQVNVDRGSHRAGAPRGDACRRGHEFTDENTVVTDRGTRVCRACKNESSRRYRERMRRGTK